MSTFIQKADYASSIQTIILDEVTNVTDALLDTAELWAIGFISSYLNTRYDVDQIFAQTGNNRHAVILQVVVDLSIWKLYQRLSPNQVPEHIQLTYEGHLSWLRGIQKGELDPPGLPRPTPPEKDHILYGSNPKVSTRI